MDQNDHDDLFVSISGMIGTVLSRALSLCPLPARPLPPGPAQIPLLLFLRQTKVDFARGRRGGQDDAGQRTGRKDGPAGVP